MTTLYLLTFGLLLAPAFAVPVPAPLTVTLPTCKDAADNGKTFIAPNASYKIECNLDYWGGDIATSTFDTFDKCIKACDALTGCVAASYVGDRCYQKGKLAATSTPNNDCWTATTLSAPGPVPVPVASLSCVDSKDNGGLYTTQRGSWDIVCGKDFSGKDFSGNDIGHADVSSFEGCIDACSATTGYVIVAYSSGSCYLKNKNSPVSDAAHVWSAKLKTGQIPVEEPTKNALSCVNNKSNNLDFLTTIGSFHIKCGTDFAGNDIKTVSVTSFEACLNECSATLECKAVALVGDACYLKNKKGDAVALGNVWGASLVGAVDIPTTPINTLSCLNKKDDNKVYSVPSGGKYLVQCAIDFAGGDLSSSVVTSFEDCIKACDVDGYCYLKNVVTSGLDREWVWGAKRVTSVVSSSSSVSSTISTSSTSSMTTSVTPSVTTSATTTTSTTSSTPTPTSSPLWSCTPGSTHTDGTNDWEIRCNIDYLSNDLASNKSPTFQACLAPCVDNPACLAVSWAMSGPTTALASQGINSCYFKAAISTARSPPSTVPTFATAIVKSPFKIISVFYSTLDITNEARAAWLTPNLGNKMIINTQSTLQYKGDPWVNVQKSIAMLYTYKGVLRMWSGYDFLGNGQVIIAPGPISNHVGSTVVPNWPQANTAAVTAINIVAVNWSISQVTFASTIANIYQTFAAKTLFWWTTPSLVVSTANDPWPGHANLKTGVVWYTDNATGTLRYITGREGSATAW